MGYYETICDNCLHHSPVSWWPKFAYHYTDVENAVSILNTGFLYSRANAQQLGLMRNDNASRQVIDMTQSEAISCIRFYFRPMTPTQYYNEGYKHPQLRYDDDENANMPVPVFFLFDLQKLLSIPGVQYSQLPQSGHGSELKSGPDDFAALPFDKIYSKGFEGIEELKKYRHAEILHPNSMKIDQCLNTILCRNSLERITLLNMLKAQNHKNFLKYQGIIKVCKENMFENNGLFLTECRYHENMISISFSDCYAKQQYIRRMMSKNCVTELKPIKIRLVLDWLNSRGNVKRNVTETQIDYCHTRGITVHGIPNVQSAKILRIQVLLDRKPMCCIEQSIEKSELIK
jgi:hypothetical protein